ncbi:uncharacterized protein PRCAT00003712001 [Priceomyces carsonii]|uniref:uncharacterized protein n=1 Tax=Priceomyces carsonii TaxID=28549 RepID=UPI002ED9D7F8|nr:unnamed protein product [Priceomyces carsonii]
MSFSGLDQVINLRVKVTTFLDETITGSIYTFSSTHEVLVLKIIVNKNTKTKSYRIINTSFVKSIQVLPPIPKKYTNWKDNEKNSFKDLKNISVEDLEHKIETALSGDQRISPDQGAKSSRLASKLYLKFCNLYGKEHVKWAGNDNIVLFDELKVSRPFTKSNIQFLVKNSKFIENVLKVLSQFWLEADDGRKGG